MKDNRLSVIGFTLVELMVAVSILAIGIVMIVRSMLGAAATLDTVQNQIQAIKILDLKLAEAQQKQKEQPDVLLANSKEDVLIGNRSGTYTQEVSSLEVEGWNEKLNQAVISVKWREGNREKEQGVVSYLKNYEKIP